MTSHSDLRRVEALDDTNAFGWQVLALIDLTIPLREVTLGELKDLVEKIETMRKESNE